MYINSIRLLEDKRRSKLYFRYRIGGKTKDETLNVEWHSEKIGSERPLSVKQIKSNKKTRRYAEKILSEKRHEMFENEYGLDYHRKQSESFFTIDDPKKLSIERTSKFKSGALQPGYRFNIKFSDFDVDYMKFLIKQKYNSIIS